MMFLHPMVMDLPLNPNFLFQIQFLFQIIVHIITSLIIFVLPPLKPLIFHNLSFMILLLICLLHLIFLLMSIMYIYHAYIHQFHKIIHMLYIIFVKFFLPIIPTFWFRFWRYFISCWLFFHMLHFPHLYLFPVSSVFSNVPDLYMCSCSSFHMFSLSFHMLWLCSQPFPSYYDILYFYVLSSLRSRFIPTQYINRCISVVVL